MECGDSTRANKSENLYVGPGIFNIFDCYSIGVLGERGGGDAVSKIRSVLTTFRFSSLQLIFRPLFNLVARLGNHN